MGSSQTYRTFLTFDQAPSPLKVGLVVVGEKVTDAVAIGDASLDEELDLPAAALVGLLDLQESASVVWVGLEPHGAY